MVVVVVVLMVAQEHLLELFEVVSCPLLLVYKGSASL